MKSTDATSESRLLAIILKRINKYSGEKSKMVKANLWDGLTDLIEEHGFSLATVAATDVSA